MKQGNKNGTQMVRPINKKQSKTETKPKIETKQKVPIKGGIRIGEYKNNDKWRCKTCKFLN